MAALTLSHAGIVNALSAFGPAPGAKMMLDWEKQAAEQAIDAGLYVTWRNSKELDCTRYMKCFVFACFVYRSH